MIDARFEFLRGMLTQWAAADAGHDKPTAEDRKLGTKMAEACRRSIENVEAHGLVEESTLF